MPGSGGAMEQSDYAFHYNTWLKHKNKPSGDKQVPAGFDEGQKWEPLKLREGQHTPNNYSTWRWWHWCVLYSRKWFLINLRGASLNVAWQLKQRMLIQGFTHCCEVTRITELRFTRWMSASSLCSLVPINSCDGFGPFLLRLVCAEIMIQTRWPEWNTVCIWPEPYSGCQFNCSLINLL